VILDSIGLEVLITQPILIISIKANNETIKVGIPNKKTMFKKVIHQ